MAVAYRQEDCVWVLYHSTMHNGFPAFWSQIGPLIQSHLFHCFPQKVLEEREDVRLVAMFLPKEFISHEAQWLTKYFHPQTSYHLQVALSKDFEGVYARLSVKHTPSLTPQQTIHFEPLAQ